MARDLDHILRTLRSCLASGEQLRGLTQLSAGYSNETYLLEGPDLILRLAPERAPLIPVAFDVLHQFAVFAVLATTPGAPPVPSVRYLEPDASKIGGAFFLMERMRGIPFSDWNAAEWALTESAAFREGLSRQAVEVVANLHQMKPLEVLGPVLSPLGELNRWRHCLDRFGGCPPLDETFDLLQRTAPAPLGSPSPCHGDLKLSNMLWEDGKFVGLLDWEMASNGDPRWDLAYMTLNHAGPHREGMPGMDASGFWDRDRIISEWEIRTARQADRILWFEAANSAKLSTIIMSGYLMTREGLSDDERYLEWEPLAYELRDRAYNLGQLDAQLSAA
ncbi:MAG: phosphotransferase family protein [Alphaproteobacteria bacterium]|nr:phosphotransferase family protein [Alphaproteobacteria bacterium]